MVDDHSRETTTEINPHILPQTDISRRMEYCVASRFQ
jgi:hypothetical protein